MEQKITLHDVANYLDSIGIQFLATIGLDDLKDIDGWITNLGHVRGLEKRADFAKPIHFKF